MTAAANGGRRAVTGGPAKKATAAKKATGTRNQPQAAAPADVMLDLDSLEKEGGRAESFTFRHEGRDFVLIDPIDMDWRDLMRALNSPLGFVEYVMSEADYKAFTRMRCPEWKMRALVSAYFGHWGIDVGEASGLSGF